ncbi:MAG: FtsX-like permease family protein, partial [Candidatus Hodarchaeota archaeon]
MFSLARRNVTRSKYRSLLIVLGTLLIIALETGIIVNIDTLYDDFILDNRNNNFTDITIIPTEWTNLSRLKTIAKDVRSRPGVTQASPVYTLYSGQILQRKLPDSKIMAYGIDPISHPDFSSLNITEGSPIVSDHTIIISESIQKMTGLKVSETVFTPPQTGYQTMNFTVGGIMSDISLFGNNIGYLFILVDIDTLYDIVPDHQRTTFLHPKIDVQVKDFLNIKKTGNDLKDHMGHDYQVWVEKSFSQLKLTGIKSYQAAMNVVILASFVVEFLFITNILTISIRDRSREFGILRTVGADTKQLIATIVIEILIYSIIGSLLGLILGVGAAWVLADIMQDFYPSLVIESLKLLPLSLFAIFLSGIIVSLIAGLYPIFLMISMPVIQNIHSRMRSGKSKYSRYFPAYWKHTVGMGALLALTGFILQFFVGPSRFLAFEVLSIHFLVVLLVFFGTLLAEIGFLFFLPKIAFRILVWFGTITRTISMRNIAREFEKSLFTIMTSTLSLTFIILVGLVSAAVVSGVPDFFESQWGSIDLIAEGQEGNLPSMSFVNELDAVNGIVSSCLIQEQRTVINNVTNSFIFGVNSTRYEPFAEEVINSLIDDVPAYYWLNQTTFGTHATHGTYAIISHLLQQELLVPLGSNVSISVGDDRYVNATVTAVIKSNAFLASGEYLYISANRFQEFFRTSEAKWCVCEVEGNLKKVADKIGAFPQFKDVTKIEYFTQVMERSLIFQSLLFQVLFVESFILAAIAQFVCILISTLRMEREVGILRSLGLHKRGVLSIFLAETTALGITAAFLGLFDGLLASLLFGWYISLSIPIRIRLSINYIVLWLLFSISVTLLSSFLPSYRSSRKNIVAAISGRPLAKEYQERVKLRQFLANNSSQLQVTFLVLLGIFSCIFIFTTSLKLSGLVPFDLVTVILISFSDLESFNRILVELNPLLIIMGLTSIGPISHLIVYKAFPANIGRELIKSFLWGLVGTFIITCSLIAMLLINISILNFLNIESILLALSQRLNWLESNLLINFIIGVIILS